MSKHLLSMLSPLQPLPVRLPFLVGPGDGDGDRAALAQTCLASMPALHFRVHSRRPTISSRCAWLHGSMALAPGASGTDGIARFSETTLSVRRRGSQILCTMHAPASKQLIPTAPVSPSSTVGTSRPGLARFVFLLRPSRSGRSRGSRAPLAHGAEYLAPCIVYRVPNQPPRTAASTGTSSTGPPNNAPCALYCPGASFCVMGACQMPRPSERPQVCNLPSYFGPPARVSRRSFSGRMLFRPLLVAKTETNLAPLHCFTWL